MKNSHKQLIRKKMVNMLVITIIIIAIGITYLGFHKANVTPTEKTEEITLIIED